MLAGIKEGSFGEMGSFSKRKPGIEGNVILTCELSLFIRLCIPFSPRELSCIKSELILRNSELESCQNLVFLFLSSKINGLDLIMLIKQLETEIEF